MGVLIRWSIPSDPDVTFDTALIERAGTQTGTYAQIASQAIGDNTYFDKDGTTAYWYKIRFFDSVNTKYSDYTDAIQGGALSLYCSVDDVRAATGLNALDISDTAIYELMKLIVIPQINHEIGVKVIREKVEYIDDTRENDIDGTTTTFYVRNWEKYYIGDLDDDGDVDTSDIIVTLVASDDTESTATVSSVDQDDGKFVLSSAPASSDEVYVTYTYTPISVSDPNRLIRLAATYLTAAGAFTRIDAKKLQNFAIGKLRIGKQSDAYKIFFDKYMEIINQIKSRPFKRAQLPDATKSEKSELPRVY